MIEACEYVEIQGNCHACGVPLVLKIGKEYYELGDPNKVRGLAYCNPCAAMRVRQMEATKDIERPLQSLAWMKVAGITPEQIVKMRCIISALLRKYIALAAESSGTLEPELDVEIVNQTMQHPGQLAVILAQIWKTYGK